MHSTRFTELTVAFTESLSAAFGVAKILTYLAKGIGFVFREGSVWSTLLEEDQLQQEIRMGCREV